MKTSMEEVSYSDLVDKICGKIKVDQAKAKLKISYIPPLVEPKKPSYIIEDDDVLGYAMQVNKDQCRSLLHVELIEDFQENQNRDSRDNRGTEVDERSGGMDSRVDDGWTDGMNLTLGQEFESKHEVQDLVEKASHENCFEFDIVKTDTTRYVVKCRQLQYGCKWFLRAAKLKDSEKFSVRTYNDTHTCSRSSSSTSKNRRKGTPGLVASLLHEDYPGKLKTPAPKDLISMVQGKLGVKVSYSTALRGKKKAINDVRGSPEESYQMLHSYLFMLEKMNPGTKTCVELEEDQWFKYLFIALGACIEGFQAMRKVIIVDGTFLKTAHGGVLIVATAQNSDRHHYPIAFGVVDGENNATWTWFMEKLKEVIPDDPEMVFVSDRNASIIKAIGEVYKQFNKS